MVAIGMAKRQDLSALAVSLRDPQGADKATLNNLVDQAKEAAGSSQGANTGTALHSLTEALDTGSPLEAGPWQADLDAYSKAMKAAGVRILPEYVERVVALDDYGVAGTLDRIVEYEGELYVGDLKAARTPQPSPTRSAFSWPVMQMPTPCLTSTSSGLKCPRSTRRKPW